MRSKGRKNEEIFEGRIRIKQGDKVQVGPSEEAKFIRLKKADTGKGNEEEAGGKIRNSQTDNIKVVPERRKNYGGK